MAQSFGAKNASGGATLSASPSSATAAGDLLVAAIRDRNGKGLAPVSTVADTNVGDHWVRATSVTQGSTNADGEIWYVANAASLATSQSVTVTVGGAQASKSAIALTVLDVTGAAASAPLDVVAVASGKTQPASTGTTPVTNQASEIAIADIGWNSGSVAVSGQTTGYTVLPTQQSTVSGSGTGEQGAYQLLSATGTQSYQATISASTAVWTGAIAIFKVGAPTPPMITSFNPTTGVVGTSVTINGAGFTGATGVTFFNGNAATVTVTDDSHINTTVPSGAATGPITVTTPGGSVTSSASLVVNPSPTPTITVFNPTSGVVGTPVTITGTGFTGASAVAVNGTAATFTVTSDTQINTTVPGGALTGQISVITPGGTATTSGLTPPTFTVVPPGMIGGTVTDSATNAVIAGAAVSYTSAGTTPPHVMVIMEENKGYTATLGTCGVGSPDPYYCSLASSYASDTSWFGVSHPSLPNYLAFDSGSEQGCSADNCLPGYTVTDLGGQMTAAGVPWTAYMESMPTACDLTSGPIPYARTHNPFVYFTDVSGNACAAHDVPYPGSGGLVSALTGANPPAFVWITPNLNDNMHDGTVAQGDVWLQANLPGVLASSWFTAGNATVVVTMDENVVQSTPAGGQVPMVVISRNAGGKGNVAIGGNHVGALRTIEEAYGLGYLGAASDPSNGDLSPLFDVSSRTTTVSDGTYTLSNVAPGTYTVTASAAGYTAQSFSVPVSSGNTATQNFALTPAPTGAISGTVSDSQTPARPVSGATVTYVDTNNTTNTGSVATDSSGGYTFGGLSPGSYSVSVTDTGFTTPSAQPVTVTAATSATANFTLTATSGISGAVSDSQTPPQPVNGATVSYTGTGGTTGSGTTTTSSGGYTFNGVTPGTYSVTVSQTGFTMPSAQPVTVNAGSSATANFTMTATSGISGTVTDQTSAPVNGATVSYTGTGGSTGSGSTTTNSSGAYTLTGVPPGTYSVSATKTGFTPPAAQPVTVTAGTSATANFTLSATSGISGAVSDSQTPARPVSGATVSYTGTGGTTGSATTTTSTSGGYTFNGVPPGTYSVTASKTGFTSPSAQPVTVSAGASATANFTMTATSGITGTVADQTSAPVNGATVSYTGTGGSTGSGSTTTNSSGGYTLTGVPPGTYSVSASAIGYTSPSAQNVTVATSTTTAGVNFTLTLSSHQPIFSDGFESGNLSSWTKTSGLTVETTTVRAGTDAAEGRLNNSPMYAQKVLPSTYASGYERVWFNIVSQTSQINVLRARTAAGANLAYVMVLQTSHVLALNVLGNKVATSATAISPGSGWHELEMYAAVNGATPSIEVWFDGSQITSLTWNGSVGSAPIGEIQIGEASAQTWDVGFDDVAFDTQFLP